MKNRMSGIAIYEALGELDDRLVAEAELDAAYLPAAALAGGREARREARRANREARREAREEAREFNSFFRFMRSTGGAVAVSLVVAFGLMLGIVYAINRGPGVEPGGTPGTGSIQADTVPDRETVKDISTPLPDSVIPTSTNHPVSYQIRITVVEPKTEDGWECKLRITGPTGSFDLKEYFRVECLEGAHAGEIMNPKVAPTGLPPGTVFDGSWETMFYMKNKGIYLFHKVVEEDGELRYLTFTTFAVGEEYQERLNQLQNRDDAAQTDPPVTSIPENSTPATYYISGVEVDCGDGDNRALLVYEPEIKNDPFVYPAETTLRIPLFATLRALGATVGENRDGIVTVNFRENTFLVDLNNERIETADGSYAMYMHASLTGTRPLETIVTSEDILLCREPFGYVMSFFNQPKDSDSLTDNCVAIGMDESKKEIYLEFLDCFYVHPET